jgi:hypothetical protein
VNFPRPSSALEAWDSDESEPSVVAVEPVENDVGGDINSEYSKRI